MRKGKEQWFVKRVTEKIKKERLCYVEEVGRYDVEWMGLVTLMQEAKEIESMQDKRGNRKSESFVKFKF